MESFSAGTDRGWVFTRSRDDAFEGSAGHSTHAGDAESSESPQRVPQDQPWFLPGGRDRNNSLAQRYCAMHVRLGSPQITAQIDKNNKHKIPSPKADPD